jgi:hypothetical protein
MLLASVSHAHSFAGRRRKGDTSGVRCYRTPKVLYRKTDDHLLSTNRYINFIKVSTSFREYSFQGKPDACKRVNRQPNLPNHINVAVTCIVRRSHL